MLQQGTDVYELAPDRLIHLIASFIITDRVGDKEFVDARDKARAALLRLLNGDDASYYNGADAYAGSNDTSQRRQYSQYTPELEDGFAGLTPPLGTIGPNGEVI